MENYRDSWTKILYESVFAWWEWDILINTVRHNDLKAKMLGYQPRFFRGKGYQGFTDLVHPDDHPKTMEAMRRVLRQETRLYQIDYRIKTRQGHYVWFMDRGIVIKTDSEGNPLVIRGVVIDLGKESQRGTDIEALIAIFKRSAEAAGGQYSFMTLCSVCKKIKKADTGWAALPEDIASLIAERVSHGICPDCLRKLYPNIAEKILERLDKEE